jgi:methyl-accepting chemotaxis protein
MDEIVSSVKHVADIMSEITLASQEQSTGIEQVNQAISQMDVMTQQNAAMVEQAAAAAEGLQNQASNLLQGVSTFKLMQGGGLPDQRTKISGQHDKPILAAKPATPAPKQIGANPALRGATRGDDWEEF